MNKGIAIATGEWIHFRNSGDFFLRRNTIEKFFEKPVPDEVSIVHGNCIYFDEIGWYEQTPPSLRVSYKEQIPVLHPATFVRTSLQKKNPFDLKYKSSADYNFFYQCCKEGVKFEYRPILISAFAKGGFSSKWERAFFEDKQIQGYYYHTFGRAQVRFLFILKKIRELYYNTVHGISIIVKGEEQIIQPYRTDDHSSFPTDF